MTGPHPNATGSLGKPYERWVAERFGQELRWWQRLVAARVLEVDKYGRLVWVNWLVSTARQVGKSWQLRGLAGWRIEQGERFGEPQLVMHTGKDIAICRKVQEPARSWARRHQAEGYYARQSNGRESVVAPDDSQWLVRGSDSVYGYSVSLGLIDEAWAIPPEVVDDGIEPTMVAMKQSQLGLLSTAHRRATSLFPKRRGLALDELAEPKETLLIEWSAPRDADNADRAAWRQASPHWDERRERMIESTLQRAIDGRSADPTEPDPIESFRAQWLNIWPAETDRAAGRPEPLLGEGVWAGLADPLSTPPESVVIAIEDRTGLGCAVAVAGVLPGSKLLVWGRTFRTRQEALNWAGLLTPTRTLAGASLSAEIRDAAKMGPAETAAALPKFRELALSGRLAHDGGAELARQIGSCWVTERAAGLVVSSSAPSDLARCACWAVWAAASEPAPRAKWAMI